MSRFCLAMVFTAMVAGQADAAEKKTYRELLKIVESAKWGEKIKVFVGEKPFATGIQGDEYEVDAIPGESRTGLWICTNGPTGPQMEYRLVVYPVETTAPKCVNGRCPLVPRGTPK